MTGRRLAGGGLLLILLLAGLFWLLTMPRRLPAAAVATAPGMAARGKLLFAAGGCAACHAVPGARGDDRLRLGGGGVLGTRFGTFYAPNISPDRRDGIGAWRLADFANAMQRGIDPEGRHLYPAFPYADYARMTAGDIADLWAYLRSLPPVRGAAPDHRLDPPWSWRRGIGLWQLAFLDPGPVIALPAGASAAVRRGQYLVEGPGHCGECHTSRTLGGVGGLDRGQWLAGALAAEGQGRVPNITPGAKGIGAWSADDIATYLRTGFTPDYDSVGGTMAEVQRNIAELPEADQAAIAAYLKAIPARDTAL